VGVLASLGISTEAARVNLLRGLAGGVAALPVAGAAALAGAVVSRALGNPVPIHPVIERVAEAPGAFETAVLVAASALAIPVLEELFFRGFLYPSLRERYGVVLGAAASAVVFASLHPGLPAQFATFALGVALALLYERSGSLVAPAAAHGLFNAANLTLALWG
jgi:hypothetical protein